MASSLVLTIKSELTQAQLQDKFQPSATKKKEAVLEVSKFLAGLPAGIDRGIVSIQTGSAAPVAASGTWTLASVVATDVASVGGVSFTFSAGAPATELDINVSVGSALAFASATDLALNTGVITETSHGYLTGDVGQLSTSGTLPTGFSASTDYHVIKIDANSYALASSQANAVAGTRIYPTALGSGNQTFTPDADKCLAFRLAQAVNAHSTLQYIVSAVAALAVVTVTCRVPGVVGNFIQFTDSDTTITSSGSGYLAGGTGGAIDAAFVADLGIS